MVPLPRRTNYTVTDLVTGLFECRVGHQQQWAIVGVLYANSAGSDYRAFYYDAGSTGATMADFVWRQLL